MINKKIAVTIISAFAAMSAFSPASAESFESIMASVSKAGWVSNGDGHQWTFSKAGGGKWQVGNGEMIASVTSAGENKVKIDGFPSSWGANGGFDYSGSNGKCTLKSDHGRHTINWSC